MANKHQIKRWDDATVAIDQIDDLPTRRFVRRVSSFAASYFLSTSDSQVCDLDLALLVEVLKGVLLKKETVIQELKGEECADWWEKED